ncbi:hypothetical protein JL722_9162 [Aureococcus anophagefferens]|nr:hypothetical protein JL722_9162 [Aureococcus anophagefferens]
MQLQLRMIERSRADGPVVVSREALELLRALALRLLRALEPVNDRSAYFDARLFDDSISSLDVVARSSRTASSGARHGARDACAAGGDARESVAASRLRRRFERARDARYRVDRLRVCDHRARVSVRGARHLRNIHLLKRGGAAYVRAVVGGAVAFETTVDGGAAFPDASWDEAYEVGCNLGERVELPGGGAGAALRAWEWDGPREWLVRASVIRCADVRYDLAETWGLAWALRPRLVAGDAEACGGLADKDLGVAGAAWASQGGDGDLTVAATLNRAGGHASLVLGRALSDSSAPRRRRCAPARRAAPALHADITVRDFRFGNPPGFERDHLLDVRAAAFCVETNHCPRRTTAGARASTPRAALATPRRARRSRRSASSADAEGVDLNFELHHGELNINAIARCLAECEAFGGPGAGAGAGAAPRRTASSSASSARRLARAAPPADAADGGAAPPPGRYEGPSGADPRTTRRRPSSRSRSAGSARPAPTRREAAAPGTALEQLAANSEESALRVGDRAACRRMLEDFPPADASVSIRNAELHVKDLFMGRHGQAEVGAGRRDAVHLPLVDVTEACLRSGDDAGRPDGEPGVGVGLAEFLERFFLKGVTHQLLRHSVVNSLVGQVSSSYLKQLVAGDLLGWSRPTRGAKPTGRRALGDDAARRAGPAAEPRGAARVVERATPPAEHAAAAAVQELAGDAAAAAATTAPGGDGGGGGTRAGDARGAPGRRPARPSTLVLTKPGHHVFLRLPIFSDGPSLREWHGAIAARLPESVRISSAGGVVARDAVDVVSGARPSSSSAQAKETR